jgi:Transcriptional regulator, AbiEi antitoxin
MNPERLVTELSSVQGGAIRMDQALECGMTPDQLRYRVRSGRWSKLGKGVFLVTAMRTVDDRLRAATATLPGAVVAHEAAAERHGLSYVEKGLATVLVHSQTTHEFPGVVVRRCHDLFPEHLTELAGMPATTVPRTIVDMAAHVSKRNLEAILDDAVADQKVTVQDVADVVATIGRSGKPGTKRLREVLESRLGEEYSGTALERKGNALLFTIEEISPAIEYPIPWRPEHRFDAAYPGQMLAIEWDSLRWHLQVAAFARDRARDREAILHGWRVLRFTWEDVTERPEVVIAAVRAALGLPTG